MDERQNKRQLKDLAHQKTYADIKARKEAAKLRRAAKGKEGARRKDVTEENWEDIHDARRASGSRTIGEQRAAELGTTPVVDDVDSSRAPIVISVASGRCRVYIDGREIDCLVPPEIAVRQKSVLA